MIRISASDLEAYRFWRASDAPPADLIARLTHTAEPTRQMSAGRAFAKVMEDGRALLTIERRDGWLFDFSDIDGQMALSPLREVKGEKLYDTPYGPVTLVCKADGIDGKTIHDQKLSERYDVERYLDSLQWKSYLQVFGADTFVYDVFVGSYDKRADDVLIREYHSISFSRYPGLARDVELAVVELAWVIKTYVPSLVTADAKTIEEETTT
jgi:hypothetical protein